MPTPRTLRMVRLSPLALLLASLAAHAQSTPAEPPLPPPRGQVLFQSHGEPPTTPDDDAPPQPQAAAPGPAPSGPVLTDAQRSSLLFTAYDLDARLDPANGQMTMRARVTLRNIGGEPLTRIALQISSSLIWASASLLPSGGIQPSAARVLQLPLAQHLIDTDADHTGKCSEAIIDLPSPLDPGATITLDTVYSGLLRASGRRLERIGAPASEALAADWDAVGSNPVQSAFNFSSSSGDVSPAPASPPTIIVALRGFGDVLWYPAASPQLFLGDGAKLFQAIGRQRLAEEQATVHLRLAVVYRGAPPVAAYFCGHGLRLAPHPDDPSVPDGTGIATADFPAEPLGFRQPSLFVVQQPEVALAPLSMPPSVSSSSSSSPPQPDSSTNTPPAGRPAGPVDALSVESSDPDALPALADSAERIAPLLQAWFGPAPLMPLSVLDHPGDPFEDLALLVAPIRKLSSSASSPALAHSLTHAWIQTGQPWFDEGLAQFISLLWIEQTQGRSAALLALNNLIQPLNIAEVSFDSEQQADAAFAPAGEPLISAGNELYYRRKAAAVWWMLRSITGEPALRQALTLWREETAEKDGPFNTDDPAVQAVAFERLLEKTSGKDLGWFFSDWVLRDRGLPDLSIAEIAPSRLPAGKGHDAGWLVSVTVHNDGAPAVDVPLSVLSGAFSTTTRIHIPGFSNATTRVVVASRPTQVLLNDGSTPEVRASSHSRQVVFQQAPSTFQN
ncbi:MAG: hypothetical protein ACLGQX_07290 [Acidobacteriota bacterium]